MVFLSGADPRSSVCQHDRLNAMATGALVMTRKLHETTIDIFSGRERTGGESFCTCRDAMVSVQGPFDCLKSVSKKRMRKFSFFSPIKLFYVFQRCMMLQCVRKHLHEVQNALLRGQKGDAKKGVVIAAER
jgi:hypothetical protein